MGSNFFNLTYFQMRCKPTRMIVVWTAQAESTTILFGLISSQLQMGMIVVSMWLTWPDTAETSLHLFQMACLITISVITEISTGMMLSEKQTVSSRFVRRTKPGRVDIRDSV